jgi:hypothetical protein
MGIASQAEHGFIASEFALFGQSLSNPPQGRVEPKQCLNNHVDRKGEIVASTDVTQLMRDDGVKLRLSKMFAETLGQQEDWNEDSENARFPVHATGQCSYGQLQR